MCSNNHVSIKDLELQWGRGKLSHLHHDAQVFDVVFLCLDQLLQNKPGQIKKQCTVTTGCSEEAAAVPPADCCARTHILPLIALALCSTSGFRGWTGVLCSGGESEEKPGYAPGSRVWTEEVKSVFTAGLNSTFFTPAQVNTWVK